MATDFRTPLDIANRALQHCGVTRITSFTQDNKNAAAVAFVYEKLRQAELRRNVWRFATRRTALRSIGETTMSITTLAWDAAKSYVAGSLIQDAGELYYAQKPVPVNQVPADHPEYWTLYFGSLTAAPYDSTVGYLAGELVYTPETNSAVVYMSLQNDNEDDPTTVPAWDADVIYNLGDTVTYSATVYQSILELNVNNTPGVLGWVTIPVAQPQRRQSRKWIRLSGTTLTSFVIIYPLGAGPYAQATTRNIFRLPNGFLREAPQAPKAGNVGWLGSSQGLALNDWEYEGNYILSSEPRLIAYRFVADVADVSAMDPMFCEGLAARIALEVCEELTQSSDKLRNIASQYKTFMSEARTVNGIETGSVQPPEDEFITVRY